MKIDLGKQGDRRDIEGEGVEGLEIRGVLDCKACLLNAELVEKLSLGNAASSPRIAMELNQEVKLALERTLQREFQKRETVDFLQRGQVIICMENRSCLQVTIRGWNRPIVGLVCSMH